MKEKIKKLLEEHDCKILEINSHTIKYIDNNGYKYSNDYHHQNFQLNIKKTVFTNRNPFHIDNWKLFLHRHNCIYLGCDTKNIYYKDNDGYKYSKSKLLNTSDPTKLFTHKFSKKNIFYKENIQYDLQKNNPYNSIIDIDSYVDTHTPCKFICGRCGKETQLRLHDILKNENRICYGCSHDVNPSRLQNIEDIKQEVSDYGYVLLNHKWTGNHTRVDVCDNLGYRGRVKLETLRYGGSFDKFSTHNPYSLQNIKLYCKLHGLECEIPNQQYINHKSIKSKCECGRIFVSSISKLLYQQQYCCPKCAIRHSTLEKKTREWLNTHNIQFEEQYMFSDCYYKKPLRFDFYLSEYNICIECQGQQHYEAVEYFGGQKGLEKQRKRDDIKRKYCQTHGIRLIEIPWTDFHNTNYIDILQSILI